MSIFLSTALGRHHHFFPKRSPWSALVPFAIIIFLISLGDAMVSYVAPVYIESHVENTAVMGIIISFSSLVGFACDFLFSKIFRNRSYVFFFWLAVFMAMLVPLTLSLFPPAIFIFIVSMAFWGIYYELLQFSDFNFIKSKISKDNYSNAWGVLSSFKATAYLLGPLVAGALISMSTHITFIGILIVEIFAAFGFYIFTKSFSVTPNVAADSEDKSSLIVEAKIWFVLIKKIWPIYLFMFLLYIIDSTFWTIGTLLTEQLKELSFWGMFLLPAYSLPSLFVGLLLSKYGRPHGKKKVAFICAALSGVFLSLVGFVKSPEIIIMAVFLSSFFLSVSFPEITAVFEDFVRRLDDHGNDMVGLQSSAISLAYIVGPVFTGFLATYTGNQLAFTVVGVILTIYSLISLVIVHPKTLLPQSDIDSISSERVST